MKIKKKVILFIFNYLPLQIWTLKICNHILKIITARSFKLCQLIENKSTCRSIGENLKKKDILLFANDLPLQTWTLKICLHDISKTITARSFKLCQLIQYDELINW